MTNEDDQTQALQTLYDCHMPLCVIVEQLCKGPRPTMAWPAITELMPRVHHEFSNAFRDTMVNAVVVRAAEWNTQVVLTAIVDAFKRRWVPADMDTAVELVRFPVWIRTVAVRMGMIIHKNTKETALVPSSDSDNDEKEEGDRRYDAGFDASGASPSSGASTSPVVSHESSSPLSVSIGGGGAAAAMEDEACVPVVHAPRRSPSQEEAVNEALQAQREAQGIESVTVPPSSSDGGAAVSESQASQDPLPCISPDMMALADQEDKEAKMAAEMDQPAPVPAAAIDVVVSPKKTGSKRGPNKPLSEPKKRKAAYKRQKTTAPRRGSKSDQEIVQQAPPPGESTRSSDKRKTRAPEARSPLPVVAGWCDDISLT